jgi:hypothetical protein
MSLPVTLVQGAYIVAGLSFILALAGLSRHETARAGNRFGIIGMTIALVATILAATAGTSVSAGRVEVSTEGSGGFGLALILAAMGIGAVIGLDRAKKVEMTGMPELIAMLHSFVGLAAVLVGWNSSVEDTPYPVIHDVEVAIGVFIGAVTFTGSIVAFLKLSARIKSAPLMLPGRNWLNLGAIAAFFVLTVVYVVMPADETMARGRAGAHHRRRARARLAPGRLDRWRRHAGRGVDAQQLLGVGGGRGRVPARQRPAHHHRRARGLLGCLPVLHHVQGDEPVVHLGHRRGVRRRGRHRGS